MGKTTRVVVCGMKGVGKTALLEQLVYGNIDVKTEIHPTIEDIYVANIETDRGTKEKVRFYDTAGLESLQSNVNNQQLPRHYLGFADGYVLVYDTGKPESLDVLFPLKKDIDKNKDKKEITVIVIGNRTKTDTVLNNLENTASKATNWCTREKIKHYEVNVMDRSSLFEAFVHLSSKLNPPTNKSTFPQLSMGRKTIKTEAQ
ncbi:NF-kappa-B inhibitor-interacting Ras-like protein [Linepithema humile]|uniref:NF-kappa-B inhibitor-interacting Ras-like protein n=1 Tax=Linepithema humile TaxID=83485 RepID=UPI000623A1F6|nr:PREDICTED: NF-kappa-B inhibitor-interacting Ras-like protein [Linepithema humile]XP_012221951.1 PREDICTED: NF-kappa-B inhibitor-interacting Ras-like protein [Linepithema humile]XP_012221952.1 PREDICTED: NF-kappa-B inhibitor-interacting Ras-like protein [Linepithema humile]